MEILFYGVVWVFVETQIVRAHIVTMQRQFPAIDKGCPRPDEFQRELGQWRCYSRETVIEDQTALS